MATLTVYPDPHVEVDTVDGHVAQTYGDGEGVVWTTLVADAGSFNQSNIAENRVVDIIADSISNKWRLLFRGIILYKTSSLGASVNISAVVMSLYGFTKYDYLSATPNIDIYTSTPASNINLTNTDYAQVQAVSQTGSPITYGNWLTNGYNDFTFNATGRGNINKTGISKFGTRNQNYDVTGTPPPWVDSSGSALYCYGAETANTTYDPKLVVTYTLGDTGAFFQLF